MISKKGQVKGAVLITLGVVLIVAVVVCLFWYIGSASRSRLADEVSSKFTCSCCQGSLLNTSDSCLMAGGMRSYISSLANAGYSKDTVMTEAVKKFGVPNLINTSLKKEYGLMFLNKTLDNVPQMVIKPSLIDLGKVNESSWAVIITDFKLLNNGTADLIIYDLKTSCSCLTASFIREDKYGQESVRVGRFSTSNGWNYIIAPGEEVTLRTYYDAKLTDWQEGHVERIITVTSNDPVYFMDGVKLVAFLVK